MVMINKVIIHSIEADHDDGVCRFIKTRLEQESGVEVILNDSANATSYKTILGEPVTTLVLFVIQTLTNDDVFEKHGGAFRFLKRMSHPADLVKFSYGKFLSSRFK